MAKRKPDLRSGIMDELKEKDPDKRTLGIRFPELFKDHPDDTKPWSDPRALPASDVQNYIDQIKYTQSPGVTTPHSPLNTYTAGANPQPGLQGLHQGPPPQIGPHSDHFTIKVGKGTSDTHIWFGNQELRNVISFTLEADAHDRGSMPKLTVVFNAEVDVQIESDADLDQEYQTPTRVLKRTGTPVRPLPAPPFP